MRDSSVRDGTRGGPSTTLLVVTVLVATALGSTACALAAHWSGVLVSDRGDLAGLRITVVALVLAAGAVATALARWRPTWLPTFVVVATGVGVSGLAAAALRGTRYGFSALFSDSAFRTEAVTRFAETGVLADYAYRGLPTYYPPAWAYVQGRTAALLDIPGWAVVKPATLVAVAVVPLLAFLLWRRVVPAGQAAAVVLLTTLATADLQKPDEWLVLALLLPWWLEVVRGVRAEGVTPRKAWVDGVIVGGLLVTHSVYFLPLGVATVLGWCLDLVRRQRPPLPLGRMLVIGAVALVVAAPYWLSLVVGRLTSASSDNLQMRWSPPGVEVPPLPVTPEWWVPLAAVGTVWVLLRLRRDSHAVGLALVLVAGYAVTVGGQWLQRYDVAVLPHKAAPVVLSALVVAGVSAGAAAVGGAGSARSRRLPGARRRLALPVGVAVAAVALALPGALAFTSVWAAGLQAQVAHQTPYPDGSFPEGHDPEQRSQVWGTRLGEPPAGEVLRAWRELSGRGPEDDSETVLVTTRTDLLATTPVHPFTVWKSVYSHPNGRYAERVALLQELAECAGPDCAADLLRHNPYDRIDGLIASRVGGALHVPLAVDDFPDGWRLIRVALPLELFSGPSFRRTDVGSVTLVAVDEP